MKRLVPIFAVIALTGCKPPEEREMTSLMQSMMDAVPGSYTFLPEDEDSIDLQSPNGTVWDLVIKTDQYTQTKDTHRLLCAHFNTVPVYMTPEGKYLLPYDRAVNDGGRMTAPSRQETEFALPDFTIQTLLNIPEYIDDKDNSTHKYRLIHTVREVCVPVVSPTYIEFKKDK